MATLAWLARAKRRLTTQGGPRWPDLHQDAMAAIATASAHADPALQTAAALYRAGWGGFAADEAGWIARIEAVRRATNASRQVVRYSDYGAREPGARPTAAQSPAGSEVERVVGEVSRSSSKPPPAAALLFALVRQCKPRSCVEMGTCVGISGAYIAAALRLNGHGRLVTLEGGDALAEVARQNLAALTLHDLVDIVVGPFKDTLLPALDAAQPIDFLFVDGHHDEHATIAYFATALPFLAPRAIAVFDDINWSAGMRRAWVSISTALECSARFPLRDFGIAVLRGGGGGVGFPQRMEG